MKTNQILEETRQVKDELAREADYDTHLFFGSLRRWSTENPHPGPVVRNAEELRRLADKEERSRGEAADLALNEKPPEGD